MNTQEQICYQYIEVDDRLKLIADIHHAGINIKAEVNEADAASLTVWTTLPGHWYRRPFPFASVNCVSLMQGGQVIDCFGRPRVSSVPAIMQYAEVY